MSAPDTVAYVSAAELAGRIRRREVSPVEVMDAAIALVERRNPSINALIIARFEEARERAKAAERALTSGAALGPLHGVPVAMKDCFDFKPGWPATIGGIRALRDFSVDEAVPFVERIEKAGAIILGKTNSPILGFRGTTDNYLFGPSRNPFDTSRNTGGSSGGSAAIVADGILPLVEGTDGGGSIRIPSSWCGVYGYKASFGRVPHVSRPNAFGGTAPFLFAGPITRTVKDAALGLMALSGFDSRDPYSFETDEDFLAATEGSIRGWKIAYTRDFGIFPVEAEVIRVTDEAVAALAAAGAEVEEVDFKIGRSQQELSDLWCRLISQSNLQAFEWLKGLGIDIVKDHPEDLPPEMHHWNEIGLGMSAKDLRRDQAMRTQVYDAIQGVLNDYRLIVSPSLACLPVKNGTDGNTVGPSEINGEAIDPLIGWCITYLVNYTGHPAASAPAGLSRDHLPVGLQLIGRRFADADVLTASAELERHRPWFQHYERCALRPLGGDGAASV